jgi:hypothetical protein
MQHGLKRGLASVLAWTIAFAVGGVLVPAAMAAPKPIEPADLDGVEAKRAVVDRVLASPPRRARAAAAAPLRTEQWHDDQGRVITISTDLETVDLAPFASVLAGTVHGDEISTVGVTAVLMSEIGSICGDQAVACYAADDPEVSGAGHMWFAVDDPDVVHTLVHEYGHHIDNQLTNFGHWGGACGWNNDGSRAWFFARDLEDDILGAGATCLADAAWEYQLAELYAEDFVALNGIVAWQLPTFRPPSESQLGALQYDLDVPFEPGSRLWKPRVRAGRLPYRTITLRHWTFLSVTLRSPPRRDFDLYVYRAGKIRPLARSTKAGRHDRLEPVLPPGRYDVAVHGYRGGGRARVAIVMD